MNNIIRGRRVFYKYPYNILTFEVFKVASSYFLMKSLRVFLFFPMHVECLVYLILLHLITLEILWLGVQNGKLLIMESSQCPVASHTPSSI
jgi:hypothetical protein